MASPVSSVISLQLSVVRNEDLTPDLRASIVALCSRAYEQDFAAYFELLAGGVHMLASNDGELTSHGAWVARELRTQDLRLNVAYIEAIATEPAFQRRGYATTIMKAIPPLLAEYDLAALSPSDAAFYERLGWRSWEGSLSYRDVRGEDIATPDEHIMILRLPRTPQTLDARATLSTDWRDIEVW